jgi:pyrimidine-nucleoside phosphorylase
MLLQAKRVSTFEEGVKLITEKIESKEGLDKLAAMVEAQGGDKEYIYHPELFPVSKNIVEVRSSRDGFVSEINALEIGEAAMKLGAGRATKEDVIDPTAGIILAKKVGDKVAKGDLLCTVYTNVEKFEDILKEIEESFKLSENKVTTHSIIYEIVQ